MASASTKKVFTRRNHRNRIQNDHNRHNENDVGDNTTTNTDIKAATNNSINKAYKKQQHQCEECETSLPSSKVSYRPLVAVNGAYLCDSCYKIKFPATAMCDINQDQNIIVSKYHEYDIRKKQNQLSVQREEEEEIEEVIARKGTSGTGNTQNNTISEKVKIKGRNKGKVYTEEEECCSCLEKGIYRTCCKKYYCHYCYYNQTRSCPGCGASIHRSGVTMNRSKPRKIAVLASWGITFFVILMLLSIISLFILHNSTRPETVWKGTCHGWFPSCNRPVCIDVDEASTIMPIEYNFCSINQTVNKVIGTSCITDPQLYQESNGLLGYDVCLQKDKEEISTTSASSNIEKFEDGVYIFEDNFDYWKNSTNYSSDSIMMKSARWSFMVNAEASDICGFNNVIQSHEVERPPLQEIVDMKSPSALVFSGVQNRMAETIDLDVTFGGRVEFFMKLAPIVENELATDCKSAFSGDIILSFSLDHGISWTSMSTYAVWKFRSQSFSFIDETIPVEAYSNHTRFRWEQPVFDSIRDFWALDDIRIFHQFQVDWRNSDWYKTKKSERWSQEQQNQCCLDTENCLSFPNYLSLESCDYKSREEDPKYRMKIVEMFITAAAIICLTKKGCHDFQQWFEDSESDHQEIGNDKPSILKKVTLDMSRSWQITAFLLLCIPFLSSLVFLSWHVFGSSKYYEKKSIQTYFYLIAIVLDFCTVRSLALKVLHFWPFRILPRIRIDKSYDNFILWIGNESIPILDISRVEMFSERFYFVLYLCVVFSSLPLAIMGILIKTLYLEFDTYIVLLELVGCSLILRSILGATWFVELYLSLTWTFTLSMTARDEMGRALEKPSVRHVVTNTAIISIVLFFVLVLSFEPLRDATALVKILIFFLVMITGSIWGSLLGMLRGLPVTPQIHLTTWPTEGFSFVNDRCIINPRTLANLFGGGMNIIHFHVLQVNVQQEFRELISGSDDLETIIETGK